MSRQTNGVLNIIHEVLFVLWTQRASQHYGVKKPEQHFVPQEGSVGTWSSGFDTICGHHHAVPMLSSLWFVRITRKVKKPFRACDGDYSFLTSWAFFHFASYFRCTVASSSKLKNMITDHNLVLLSSIVSNSVVCCLLALCCDMPNERHYIRGRPVVVELISCRLLLCDHSLTSKIFTIRPKRTSCASARAVLTSGSTCPNDSSDGVLLQLSFIRQVVDQLLLCEGNCMWKKLPWHHHLH